MEKKKRFALKLFLIISICILLNSACKKDDNGNNDPAPSPTTGTMSDIDGNNYKTIKIGDQWWMAENLKTTSFNDGLSIPLVSDSIAWSNMASPAYCWYDNDKSANGNIYGALYNWHAINSEKLCPSGWHIPTESDWTTLITYLGVASLAGGKLKETGTSHWLDPNTGASNETAFTGLPGGYRYYNGTYFGKKCAGYWWSATEIDTYEAWYLYTFYLNGSIQKVNNFKRCGMSVRCVKD